MVGPFGSMNGIHIIQGKPAFEQTSWQAKSSQADATTTALLKTQTLFAPSSLWSTSTDLGRQSALRSFSIADAKKAGTKNLDKFPRNMLFARAMSNGVRWYCPDVMNGSAVYTPEELGADVDQDGNVINVEWLTRYASQNQNQNWWWLLSKQSLTAINGHAQCHQKFLKEALQIKSAKAKPATEKQINLTRVLLQEHFADREDERHQAQEYLTGHKSFKDIEPEMISAMLDWMKPEKATDGSGAYVLGKDAKIELTMVARKFMEDLGQQTIEF